MAFILRPAAPALVWMLLSSALPAEELPEIVSIGSYTPTPAGRLSRAAAVVDTADVEARRSVDGADLLRHVAGVHVAQPTGPGGVTSVFVRGGEPNFTVVLIDGVRVNDPMNTRGGSFDFTTLAAGEISRLELVRGPQSAVHGSDAIGGVINVVTHEPDDRFSGRFDVEAGSRAYDRETLQLGGALGRHRLGAVATHVNDGGRSHDSRFDGSSVSVKASGVLERTEYRVVARFADGVKHGFPDDSGGPRYAVLRALDRGDKSDRGVGGTVEHRWTDRWVSRGMVNVYRREDSFASPGVAPGERAGIPPNSSRSVLERRHLQFHARREAGALGIGFGGEYHVERGDAHGLIELAPGFELPSDFTIERRVPAAFVELDYAASEQLVLSGSLRWDDPDTAAAASTWHLGVLRRSADGRTTWRGNASTGFKLPSFFALGNPLVGNPDLVEERARALDVGIARQLTAGLTADVFAFAARYEDLIDFDAVLFTNVNRSRVDAAGIEAALRWDVGPSTYFAAHVSRVELDVSSGRLRNRPKWRGGVSVRRGFGERLLLDLRWLGIGETFDSSVPTGDALLSSHRRLDATLSWEVGGGTRVAFAVDNLLDDRYEEAIGFPAPGRRLRASAAYRF